MTQYALHDKHEGDKLWAFETNGIMKALRTLFSNFLDLVNNSHWTFISSVSLSGSLSIPANCNFIIIQATSTDNGSGRPFSGQICLARSGITSGLIEASAYTSYVDSISASWSGNTLSIGGANGGTVYFYT